MRSRRLVRTDCRKPIRPGNIETRVDNSIKRESRPNIGSQRFAPKRYWAPPCRERRQRKELERYSHYSDGNRANSEIFLSQKERKIPI